MASLVGEGARVAVLTDMEPDDCLALEVLLRRPSDFCVKVVVTGEGNPVTKANRVRAILSGSRARDATVLPGVPSSKLFPGEIEVEDGGAGDAAADAAAFLDAVADCDLLVCLKPPREIVAAMTWQRDRAVEAFSRMSLALYGSFNLRVLRGAHGGYDYNWLHGEGCPFSRVIIYESYGGLLTDGGKKVNALQVPSLFEVLERDPTLAHVLEACQIWDADVVLDCDQTCAAVQAAAEAGDAEAQATWNRNDKCRQDVRACMGRQFVPADFVLAVVLNNEVFHSHLIPATYTFTGVSPYPTIVTDPDATSGTKVFVYKDLQFDEVMEQLQRTLLSSK